MCFEHKSSIFLLTALEVIHSKMEQIFQTVEGKTEMYFAKF